MNIARQVETLCFFTANKKAKPCMLETIGGVSMQECIHAHYLLAVCVTIGQQKSR